MKVRIVHEITDDQRKSLAQSLGKPGLANREDILKHVGDVVSTNLETLVDDFPRKRRPRKQSPQADSAAAPDAG